MEKKEAYRLIEELKLVFDIVRLVDVSMAAQCSINSSGEIIREPYQCYAVWHKDRRCENCISAKTFTQKKQMTKYEFIDNLVYYVISKPLEVDGEPFALEMVSVVSDETLFGAFGRNEFIQAITDLNDKLYIDPLTHIYNRRYYDEQLSGLVHNTDAFALMDVDDFKSINDTYGHKAGDIALKAIADTLVSSSRGADAVIRYGGDEFFVIFRKITKEDFAERLEVMREAVETMALDGYPDIHLSISIGGVYYRQGMTDVTDKVDRALYEAKRKKNHVQIV